MVIVAGFVLIVLLGLSMIEAKKRGLSAGKTALVVLVGTIAIVILTFGVLVWGFQGFG